MAINMKAFNKGFDSGNTGGSLQNKFNEIKSNRSEGQRLAEEIRNEKDPAYKKQYEEQLQLYRAQRNKEKDEAGRRRKHITKEHDSEINKKAAQDAYYGNQPVSTYATIRAHQDLADANIENDESGEKDFKYYTERLNARANEARQMRKQHQENLKKAKETNMKTKGRYIK